MQRSIIDRAGYLGVEEIEIAMAHRGRLNVLANVLGKPLEQMLSEFTEGVKPASGEGEEEVYTGSGVYDMSCLPPELEEELHDFFSGEAEIVAQLEDFDGLVPGRKSEASDHEEDQSITLSFRTDPSPSDHPGPDDRHRDLQPDEDWDDHNDWDWDWQPGDDDDDHDDDDDNDDDDNDDDDEDEDDGDDDDDEDEDDDDDEDEDEDEDDHDRRWRVDCLLDRRWRVDCWTAERKQNNL